MNSFLTATKSIPLRGVVARSFHTNMPCFTGKTFEATSDNFKDLVLEADHPVLVDFYADWCGPCKMLTPILTKAVAETTDVSLIKVDTDENLDISRAYKISALPTVVAFHKGKEVDRFVGMRNKAQLDAFIKAHAERS